MYKEGYRRRVFAAFVLSTALALPMTADAMSLTLAEAIHTALTANTGLRVTQTSERSADAAVTPCVRARHGMRMRRRATRSHFRRVCRSTAAVQMRRISQRVNSAHVRRVLPPSVRVRI